MKAKVKEQIIDFIQYKNKIYELGDWIDTFGEPISNVIYIGEKLALNYHGSRVIIHENDYLIRNSAGNYNVIGEKEFINTYDVL